jgi:FixJ family two-component response regulator
LPQVPVVSIVDDDESVRAGMSSLIRSLGYEAYTFSSGEEFLSSPRVHDTGCLILDVQMPGMTGPELQNELATRRFALPIIFITAFPEERVRQRVEAAGAVGFFTKPVDGSTIVGCIEAVLQRG